MLLRFHSWCSVLYIYPVDLNVCCSNPALTWSRLSCDFTHLLWCVIWCDVTVTSQCTSRAAVSDQWNCSCFCFYLQCCPMAAAPAESSSSHGKGLGLSHSDSSSALDYSGDTFESFGEEQETEAPGSWCSTEDLEGAAVSEALGSSSSVAGQSPAGMQSSPCLGPAFHSFSHSVQWGLETVKINMWKLHAVQSALQIPASDSSMGKTWPWKSVLSNLVMLKFCWCLKKQFSKLLFTMYEK